jgi:hypothetical protein
MQRFVVRIDVGLREHDCDSDHTRDDGERRNDRDDDHNDDRDGFRDEHRSNGCSHERGRRHALSRREEDGREGHSRVVIEQGAQEAAR